MAVGAANYVNVFFAEGFIKQAGCEALIWGYFFVANRADSLEPRLTPRVTVRAPHYYHELVRNVHRAVNFRDYIFPYKEI